MLGRSKNGVFSVAAAIFFRHSYLFSSSYSSLSSNPNPNFRNQSFRSRAPARINSNGRHIASPVRRRDAPNPCEPRYESDNPCSEISPNASPDVVSICFLLTNSNERTRNVDSLLKDFRKKLDSDLVLAILMNYRHLGRKNTLEFFSWAGFHLGFRFDDCVVEYMADFLGRRKLFDDMKCLLKTVSSVKGRVSCRTVSICVRFLGRQGRIVEALSLFREMELEFNCKPDNLVFNNMLYVLCKKESSGEFLDDALVIFRAIEKPDTYSYSNILVGLCKFGRLDSAIEVFHEMGKVGLVPTRSAVNILIGELCEMSTNEERIEKVKVTDCRRPFTILVPNVRSRCGGTIEPATRVFWKLHDLGLLPSAFIINRLISELCRLRKIEAAVKILRVVEDRKLTCVDESYSIVIRALCEVRRVDEACKLFGKMVSRGLKPKLLVYNSIICALCKFGGIEEADRLFEIMNKKRCVPDNVTYTALIHGHAGVRNWEAAYALLLEMLRLGWCPHFHTYNLVYRLLKEYEKMDLLRKLEGKLEAQLLQKDCKAGRLESAYEKLRYMHEKGFNLPNYTRNVFERAFQKAGKWKIACGLLERMDQGILEVTSETEEVSV